MDTGQCHQISQRERAGQPKCPVTFSEKSLKNTIFGRPGGGGEVARATSPDAHARFSNHVLKNLSEQKKKVRSKQMFQVDSVHDADQGSRPIRGPVTLGLRLMRRKIGKRKNVRLLRVY